MEEIVLEGDVESPQYKQKIFESWEELISFLDFCKPHQSQILTGQNSSGVLVFQLTYSLSNWRGNGVETKA